MTSDTDRKEIAVVVGATGAFGNTMVDRLVDAGLKVIAVARSADSLAELQARQPSIGLCVADISGDASIASIREVLDRPVRAVVHGPGVGVAGGILVAPTATMVDAVNIKVGGLLRLRITSYNVCYTKLLRFARAPGPGSSRPRSRRCAEPRP